MLSIQKIPLGLGQQSYISCQNCKVGSYRRWEDKKFSPIQIFREIDIFEGSDFDFK